MGAVWRRVGACYLLLLEGKQYWQAGELIPYLMAIKEAKYPKYTLSVKKKRMVIFLFNFSLPRANCDSIASRRAFITAVTLRKIWYMFPCNCCQIPNWSRADDLFSQWPFGPCLSACGRVITRVGGRRKPAYLISRASDSTEWDRKVLVPELPPQIAALSSAWVYLLDGGRVEKWQGKPLSFSEDWKVALVLPARHEVREVNVKSHSK